MAYNSWIIAGRKRYSPGKGSLWLSASGGGGGGGDPRIILWGVHPVVSRSQRDYLQFHEAQPTKAHRLGMRKNELPRAAPSIWISNEIRSCIEREKGDSMRQNGSFGILVFVIIAGLGGVLAFLVNGIVGNIAAVWRRSSALFGRREGWTVSKKQVQRLRRLVGLRVKPPKKRTRRRGASTSWLEP
jgi:hypothetical protein